MLSGDKLGIIDPHQQIFPASSHCWNIAKRSDLLTTVPHQLEPFLGMFGCDRDTFRSGFYKGTLFRFPLRAKPSQLSSILCTDEKIQCLLESFEHDAHLLLLFLRNLERIAIYEREKGSKTNRLIFQAEISSSCVQEVNIIFSNFRFLSGHLVNNGCLNRVNVKPTPDQIEHFIEFKVLGRRC